MINRLVLIAASIAVLALLPVTWVLADCGYGAGPGHWRCSEGATNQSADAAATSNSVTLKVGIDTQDQVDSAPAVAPRSRVIEQPKGGSQAAVPPFSIPARSTPGSPPGPPLTGGSPPTGDVSPRLPSNGANLIVPGGPLSTESGPDQPPITVGGLSIGGWTMDTPVIDGVTTDFAPVGPVPHIDSPRPGRAS